MLKRIAIAAAVTLSLAVGNILYQAFTDKNWSVALDRSYFQGIACFFCAFIYRF